MSSRAFIIIFSAALLSPKRPDLLANSTTHRINGNTYNILQQQSLCMILAFLMQNIDQELG